MAHEVVKTSGTVTSLLNGLEPMLDEIEGRLSALHFLDLRDMINDTERSAVDRVLSRALRGHDGAHPAYKAWAAVIEALTHDADAALPR